MTDVPWGPPGPDPVQGPATQAEADDEADLLRDTTPYAPHGDPGWDAPRWTAADLDNEPGPGDDGLGAINQAEPEAG